MIEFTQYMRPNGRKVQVNIVRTPPIELKAAELRDKGYRFEIEELMTGVISMTVEKSGLDEPVSHKLVQNGPKVPETVDALIEDAWNKMTDKYLTNT